MIITEIKVTRVERAGKMKPQISILTENYLIYYEGIEVEMYNNLHFKQD